MVRPRSLSLLLVCLFASLSASGATHVWSGAADDRFSNAANWIGGSPANDTSAELSFPASARLTATNDLTGLAVQSVSFSASGFTIAGNRITLGATATLIDTSNGANTISCDLLLAGDVSASVSSSTRLTLSGAISGSGGITIRNGGWLIYTGSQPNTYTGVTRILFGELQLKKPANVTAIAGAVDVEDDGYSRYGYLNAFNDEQIADAAHITIGPLGTFATDALETLGAATFARGAHLQTSTQRSGMITSTGTLVFAADIDVIGTEQRDVSVSGKCVLSGTRTITVAPGFGAFSGGNFSSKTPGAGLTIRGGSALDDAVTLYASTYDGPTTIIGGRVSVDASNSAVALQAGRYVGHCKALTATGGQVDTHTYPGVTSDGDVRLSPAVTLLTAVVKAMTMNGTLDLGGASLQIDQTSPFGYGTVYKVIDNTSANPVIGTFAGLPEGAMIENRYKISYAGGDGNDVTLTDLGLVPATVSVSVATHSVIVGTANDFTATVTASQMSPTGTVTFSAGSTVLGTVPLTSGAATVSAGSSLPVGSYSVTAAYSGDSRVAAATGSTYLDVVYPTPTLTSVDPSTVTAGVTTALTLHGTNFVSGTMVFVGATGVPMTFLSPTELRVDNTPPASESNYQQTLTVQQPGPYYSGSRSNPISLNVTGVKKSPPPLTFSAVEYSATWPGVTPGAMTFWLVNAIGSPSIYSFTTTASDTDHDGSVMIAFPFKVTSLPQYGTWLAADLSAHTIVADNPAHTVSQRLAVPAKAFLRDTNGNYTHLQIATSTGYAPWTFGWARAGVGAWQLTFSDNATLDEDGTGNGAVTFETSSMQRVSGTTAQPPADGIKPGDTFMAMDGFGQVWWGDAVDAHLAESDGAGNIGFPSDRMNALESSGSAKVIVQRTEGTDGTVTVRYTTVDDTAIAGRNYTAQAGTLTFGPGEILKTIAVPLINDDSYAGDTQFKVALSDAAGAPLTALTSKSVTIIDDEKPPVLSIVAPASVPEGDAGQVDVPVTVKLAGRASVPVTVTWFSNEGSSGPSHTGQLAFAPGETQKTFTTSFIANTIPEPDRNLLIRLWSPTNATAPVDGTTIRIVDDDFAGVSVADASVTERAGNVVVPLQMSGASLKPITVTYETRNGTAVAGSDYVAKSGTITVSSGSSITIPIVDDTVAETLEVFEVVLTSITGGRLEHSTAAVTIVDDDTPAGQAVLNLSPAVTTIQEGDTGTRDIAVNVTVTGFLSQAATVSWTWGEPAGPPHSGTLQFLPGETQKSFNVTYAANTLPEPDRRISISLSNATGAAIAGGNAVITILDDDYATLSLGDVTVTENAGFAVVPFVLSEVSMKPVTVSYSTAGDSAVDGTDFNGTTGTITFAPGTTHVTVSVPIINDSLIEPDETFRLAASALQNAHAGRLTATVTILDDDAAPAPPSRHRAARH